VLHADRNQSASAGRQSIAAAVEDQRRIARHHEEALLERLHVQVDSTAGIELAEAPARVHGADGPVRQRGAAVSRGVLRKRRCRLDIGGANKVVHGGLRRN
jgi:hypothetical protein